MKRYFMFAFLLLFCLVNIGIVVLRFIGRDAMGPLGITYHIWLTVLGFSLLGVGVVALGLTEFLERCRCQNPLMKRQQLDDSSFGRRYFPDSSEKRSVAIELRNLLAANLRADLGGLKPDDSLEELNADLINNPSLFLDLETQLNIQTPVESDLKSHIALCRSLSTFHDLLEYVLFSMSGLSGR